MKQKILRWMCATLCLCMLFGLTACSSSVNLTGSWSTPISVLDVESEEESDAKMIWTFREDGTGTKTSVGLTGGEITMEFTYTLTEDKLNLIFEEDVEPEQTFTVSRNGKTLTLKQERQTIKLKKEKQS